MNTLATQRCVPCGGGTPPLTETEIAPLLEQINSAWQVIDNHHLEREYRLKNFAEALSFTNQVGDIAETEFHHPDLFLAWGKVRVTIWSHKINGLSEADFVFSAKCDQAFEATTPSES